MPFTIVCERLPHFLRHEAGGPASLEDGSDLIAAARAWLLQD